MLLGSFEHDFVQVDTPTEHDSGSTKIMADEHSKMGSGTTRWNAKVDIYGPEQLKI